MQKHTTEQQQEGEFLVSYDTLHQKGETKSPLDINNTKVYVSMTNNIIYWDEGENPILLWRNSGLIYSPSLNKFKDCF